MKIVIKIPDEDLYDIKCEGIKFVRQREMLWRAIENGTPLPKGHGRLIEEPTETDISNTVGGDNDFAECIRDSVKAVFDNATTVVEADESEDK